MYTYTDQTYLFDAKPFVSLPKDVKKISTIKSFNPSSTCAFLEAHTKKQAIELFSWITDVAENEGGEFVDISHVESNKEFIISTWIILDTGKLCNIIAACPEHIFNEIFGPRVDEILHFVCTPIKLVRFFLVNMEEVVK